MKLPAVLLVLLGALVAARPALAVPPAITSVAIQDRHPDVGFSAPRADSVSVYIASKPDRATDGRFLTENVEVFDELTTAEIQSGRWLYESRLDPGSYWVMLRASPEFDACWSWDRGTYDPSCAQGFSNVVSLVVPKPLVRYTATARATFWTHSRPDLTLTLTASPLGERRAYKVCWRQMVGARFRWRQICRRGVLSGYSWDARASDTISFEYDETRMARVTTFTWLVGGNKVASRRIKTCRCD